MKKFLISSELLDAIGSILDELPCKTSRRMLNALENEIKTQNEKELEEKKKQDSKQK